MELNNYLIEEKYDKIEEIFKDKNERRKIKNEDYYFILKEIVGVWLLHTSWYWPDPERDVISL